jgi:hypothetical protein
MSELITLAEIAKLLGVPRGDVKEHFNRGRYLEFVPRPQKPEREWRIYRKDFDRAVARKEQQLAEERVSWDGLFTLDVLLLD